MARLVISPAEHTHNLRIVRIAKNWSTTRPNLVHIFGEQALKSDRFVRHLLEVSKACASSVDALKVLYEKRDVRTKSAIPHKGLSRVHDWRPADALAAYAQLVAQAQTISTSSNSPNPETQQVCTIINTITNENFLNPQHDQAATIQAHDDAITTTTPAQTEEVLIRISSDSANRGVKRKRKQPRIRKATVPKTLSVSSSPPTIPAAASGVFNTFLTEESHTLSIEESEIEEARNISSNDMLFSDQSSPIRISSPKSPEHSLTDDVSLVEHKDLFDETENRAELCSPCTHLSNHCHDQTHPSHDLTAVISQPVASAEPVAYSRVKDIELQSQDREENSTKGVPKQTPEKTEADVHIMLSKDLSEGPPTSSRKHITTSPRPGQSLGGELELGSTGSLVRYLHMQDSVLPKLPDANENLPLMRQENACSVSPGLEKPTSVDACEEKKLSQKRKFSDDASDIAQLHSFEASCAEKDDILRAYNSLGPGQWLTDLALELVLRCFESENVLILDPLWIQSSTRPKSSKSPWRTRYKPKILAPLHQNNHWTLALIDIDNRRIDFYDSLDQDKYADDASKKLMLYCSTLSLTDGPAKLEAASPSGLAAAIPWTFHSVGCARQQNVTDCGVHALVNALYLLAQMPVPANIEDRSWRLIFQSVVAAHLTEAERPDQHLKPFTLDVAKAMPVKLIGIGIDTGFSPHDCSPGFFLDGVKHNLQMFATKYNESQRLNALLELTCKLIQTLLARCDETATREMVTYEAALGECRRKREHAASVLRYASLLDPPYREQSSSGATLQIEKIKQDSRKISMKVRGFELRSTARNAACDQGLRIRAAVEAEIRDAEATRDDYRAKLQSLLEAT